MLWIALGAALTIYLLGKENQRLRKSDALLAGALSGLVGGGIFAVLSLVTIIGITQEQLDRMVEKAQALAPFLTRTDTAAMHGRQPVQNHHDHQRCASSFWPPSSPGRSPA